MSKADDSLDLCSLKTFAEMSGVSVEEAADWANPSDASRGLPHGQSRAPAGRPKSESFHG